MKKIWMVLLALVLVLSLCACEQIGALFSREYTFPENTTILGVDVAGVNKEDAWAKLEAAAGSYALDLTADGTPVHISGPEIDLTCSREAFMAGVGALEAGEEADFSRVVDFNDEKLRTLLDRSLNKPAKDAAIVYDEAAGQFLLEPHAEGMRVDPNAIAATLEDTIRTLTPRQTLNGVSEVLLPERFEDAPNAQDALKQANKMAAVELTYTFGAGSSSPTVHQIPGQIIHSFIDMGADGFTPAIDQEAVAAYVAELAATYNTEPRLDAFRTTGGEIIEMTIPHEGCHVDTAVLAQDIFTCVYYGISGDRTAPYLGNSNHEMPYGGTYIEVDLTSQHLWYYVDGECLISTDLVSGNVALNMHTPTGVFSIYSRSRSVVLEGPDYESYVNYWMPFIGGYGLHDATWRDEFGGDIYLDDGSHGCVNLPLEAAKTLYNNSTWGTRIILYGGEGSVPAREQILWGPAEHDVADDAEPFKLNIRSRYAWPDFYYQSDNPEVATVDSDGEVTVTGIGTAKITVTCTTESYYESTSTMVTVTVHSACDEDRHEMGDPVVTTSPTCQPGVETTTCTRCDYFTEEPISPIADHSFDGNAACGVCGAENPEFSEPAADE